VAGKTVITFGTFDVFHVGHVRVLNRSAALGDRLVVGVSSDKLNFAKKGRNPVFTQEERLEIVANVKAVDDVFIEESLEQKRDYVLQHKADILVMGDDWQGKFDYLNDIVRLSTCRVRHQSRQPPSSSRSSAIPDSAGSPIAEPPAPCLGIAPSGFLTVWRE
jgi:glycerol-3-phosphate cytidylyltransferase